MCECLEDDGARGTSGLTPLQRQCHWHGCASGYIDWLTEIQCDAWGQATRRLVSGLSDPPHRLGPCACAGSHLQLHWSRLATYGIELVLAVIETQTVDSELPSRGPGRIGAVVGVDNVDRIGSSIIGLRNKAVAELPRCIADQSDPTLEALHTQNQLERGVGYRLRGTVCGRNLSSDDDRLLAKGQCGRDIESTSAVRHNRSRRWWWHLLHLHDALSLRRLSGNARSNRCQRIAAVRQSTGVPLHHPWRSIESP